MIQNIQADTRLDMRMGQRNANKVAGRPQPLISQSTSELGRPSNRNHRRSPGTLSFGGLQYVPISSPKFPRASASIALPLIFSAARSISSKTGMTCSARVEYLPFSLQDNFGWTPSAMEAEQLY